MDIRITEELFKAVGVTKWSEWGMDKESTRWNGTMLDLRRFGNNSVARLRALIAPHVKITGVKGMLRDLDIWIEASKVGAANVKCKTTKHFSGLCFEYMQKQPGYRLYKKDAERDVWRAYYLGDIEFHEKTRSHNGRVEPAHTLLELFYSELGIRHKEVLRYEDSDVRGMTVPEALAEEGYVVESPELKAEYDAMTAKYDAIYNQVGKQYLATGIGTDNLDGNEDGEDRSWRWRVSTIILDKGGEPSRVVVDIPFEGDTPKEDKDSTFNPDFWRAKSLLEAHPDEDLDQIDPEDADPDAPTLDISVPVFHVVPCFDLRRHTRLRIHVGNLTEYVYDPSMGSRLILPQEVTDLVALLVSEKSEFRDIVKGKGGGAVILCAGPAGCGKTLTAEVYAEVMGRPLYSVQCSQLGTDEEELEKELLRVFARSQRWNSILLLDEADVYVAARGSDLQQNAIVGVFLRVLEYYGGVLFMTTNRSDLVDDAITSRCLARIDYQVPTPEDQKRIWRVLATVSGIEVPDATINAVVEKWPRLSGRDVKQLLKLSSRVMKSRGEKVLSPETVAFVKRFKPTPGNDESTLAGTGKRLVVGAPK